MSDSKTILITGANAGLGLEAARQLALSDAGWTQILLGCRSTAKAQSARDQLVHWTGLPAKTFGEAIMDLTLPDTISAAVAALSAGGVKLDAVLLNGGGMSQLEADGTPRKTASGYTELFAMNIGGHAQLVSQLLASELFNPGATILFAGSEASRGIDMMRLKAPTLPEGHGDMYSTLEAIATGEHAGKQYNPMADYGLIKLIGTTWMRHLNVKHSGHIRALSVSPGMTAGTQGTDGMPTWQRLPMKYLMLPMMKLMGFAHNTSTGAARYVEALENPALEAGAFYASRGRGVTGPLSRQPAELQPLLEDDAFTSSVGRLLATVAA